MNDIQVEHDDHDDLREDTNNDHHSDGNDSDDGNHSGDNGGGERVREGANNDRDGGDGNNDSNNDSNGGDGDGNNDSNGGDGNGDSNGGDDDGDNGGGGEGGIGYADAMSELEQILRDLEGDDLDVDMLASRVERASLLIGLCRTRIGAARVQVERVVVTLDSGDDKYGIEAGSEAGN